MDAIKPNAAAAEHRYRTARLNLRGINRRTDTRHHAAPDERGLPERHGFINRHNRVLRHQRLGAKGAQARHLINLAAICFLGWAAGVIGR